MILRRPPRVRRLLAALLGLSLALSTAEMNIADVHDGDAPAAELARADRPVSSECAGVHSAKQPVLPEGPGHPVHVCHTGHAHAGWIGVAAAMPIVAPPVIAVPEPANQANADFVPLPAVPPPIA